jgi:hypothetical protein
MASNNATAMNVQSSNRARFYRAVESRKKSGLRPLRTAIPARDSV